MSEFNATTSTNRQGGIAATVAAAIGDGRLREIAVYTDYAGAQRAVDHLSDRRFPVEHVRVVGSGVTTVETGHGRMTKGKAALLGAGAGAWFGLLLGFVLGIFLPAIFWLTILLTSVALGAVWGAVFGFVGHWSTRGKRDFASTRSLAAERYSVLVDEGYAVDAERLLAERLLADAA
jgi:hypothetical protein